MTSLQVGLAVVVGILAAARLTRIATQDDFPPAVRLRVWWDTITKDGEWSKLAHCHWCLAPWITLVVGGVGWLTGFHPVWWAFCIWMAASYVASWVVHHDEDGA